MRSVFRLKKNGYTGRISLDYISSDNLGIIKRVVMRILEKNPYLHRSTYVDP